MTPRAALPLPASTQPAEMRLRDFWKRCGKQGCYLLLLNLFGNNVSKRIVPTQEEAVAQGSGGLCGRCGGSWPQGLMPRPPQRRLPCPPPGQPVLGSSPSGDGSSQQMNFVSKASLSDLSRQSFGSSCGGALCSRERFSSEEDQGEGGQARSARERLPAEGSGFLPACRAELQDAQTSPKGRHAPAFTRQTPGHSSRPG